MNRQSAIRLTAGAFLAGSLALFAATAPSFAETQASPEIGRTFETPCDAVRALRCAVRQSDRAELRAIFGPASGPLLNSGDQVQDRARLGRIKLLFEEDERIDRRADGTVNLILGQERWPFPVPISRAEQGWYFDTEAGKQAILDRRIGQNELEAIAAARRYVEAQREYASEDRDGDGEAEFARRILSSPGKRDGLFWARRPGESPSPLGPLAARAADQGYEAGGSKPLPFQGYYFRILTRQGEHAPGGRMNYVRKDGSMSDGFALLAYPAKWGSSGIMSFMVGDTGTIYESDLGENTERTARKIESFDPGPGWQALDEQDEAEE